MQAALKYAELMDKAYKENDTDAVLAEQVRLCSSAGPDFGAAQLWGQVVDIVVASFGTQQAGCAAHAWRGVCLIEISTTIQVMQAESMCQRRQSLAGDLTAPLTFHTPCRPAPNLHRAVFALQAEGAMFFRTIEPFVAEANNRSAATVKRVLSVGAPADGKALATVRPALEATYPDLGIEPSDIGTYGAVQALNCPKATNAAGTHAVAPVGSLVLALFAVLLVLVL